MPEVEELIPEPDGETVATGGAIGVSPVQRAQPPPMTGDAAVDEVVGLLVEVGDLPLENRPAVFEDVHRALTDRLADVES